jgi:mRNA-degrading endonuclease YafQ of YafQ-DinJ toxin-antitoxin module
MKIHDIHLKKKTLVHGLHDVCKLLADDKKLSEKCHHHSLAGDWKDHQDAISSQQA